MSPVLPLAGIRVLTFENFGAGPYGSLYLADLGAEVVKVENREQGGDATRGMGPFFLGEHDSHFFQTFNLNKKSVTLNLKLPEGQEAFRRLVRTADVVMNNLRGDQPAKLGLDYASLASVNPRVVCAHLSAYGRDNERRGWPGYDYLMQAEAGYLHLTGEPGTPPARMGLSIVDFMTGITTAVAVLAALIGVMKTGRGGDVDVSLFDVALPQLTYPGNWYLNEGHRT
ncbi:MAG TPA: CoA transferase, partial [Steroidobacteraceae bacterium]|nr:CoA transferase [Steroidobacteraceae bacterium]